MKQINFEKSNYDHKEELKAFVSTLEDATQKFNKTFENADSELKKIEANIEKKKDSIEKLDTASKELFQKKEELEKLRELSNDEIKELEEKKKTVVFTDTEVQKMELDDLESLISSKKNKIAKIDTKISSTEEKEKANDDNRKEAESELDVLNASKKKQEESVYRTESLLKLINSTMDMFKNSVQEILNSKYVDVTPKENITEKTESTSEINVLNTIEERDGEEVIDDHENDFLLDSSVEGISDEVESTDIDIDAPSSDVVTEEAKTNESELSKEENSNVLTHTQEMSILDFDIMNIPDEMETKQEEIPEKPVNYESLLRGAFDKEAINFDDFSEEVKKKMIDNADKVIKNIVVLKKHLIPLELTVNQSEIYYNIEPQDLDDLLNIITTDEDGNGMGYTIDYTYYILDELSKIDVDKLIDVYKKKNINIKDKSGLIKLLKMTNPDIKEFKENRKINIDTLKSIGVNNTDEIVKEYPDFVDMDNPLFLNVLNLFDKEDLVSKFNKDVKVIPKILEYWSNN